MSEQQNGTQRGKQQGGKRGRGRQFSADEKLKILEEARQPGTTVAEVLRRYQLEGTTFYRWEKEAKVAMRILEAHHASVSITSPSSVDRTGVQPFEKEG